MDALSELVVYPYLSVFFTRVAGVYRHGDTEWTGGRPGLYRVIANHYGWEAVCFFSDGDVSHQHAVCDDFGNLVRVQ